MMCSAARPERSNSCSKNGPREFAQRSRLGVVTARGALVNQTPYIFIYSYIFIHIQHMK